MLSLKMAAAREGRHGTGCERLCIKRSESVDWWAVDFIRLATDPRALSASRIYVTGYLVVDGGQVSLYENVESYDLQVRSKSGIGGGLERIFRAVSG